MNSIYIIDLEQKFVLLGIVLGLSISNYGFKGLILCGYKYMFINYSYDLQNKIKEQRF